MAGQGVRAGAICFHSEDAVFAGELARYLELQTPLSCELVEAKTAANFLDAIEQCLVKEFVIAILSPSAVPAPWPRQLWEPVLLDGVRDAGTHIGHLVRGNCAFPQSLLRKRNVFDGSGKRALRQWVIQLAAPERLPPPIGIEVEEDSSLLALLNTPGVRRNVSPAAAAWLMRECWRDFEAVYRVQCGRGTRAAVLGELGQAMRLRLPGTVDQNWQQLQAHVLQERSLIVFEHLPNALAGIAEIGGKSSVLWLSDGVQKVETFARLKDLFASSADENACLRALGRFMDQDTEADDWPALRSFCLSGLRFLRQQDRLAEAHELLEWLDERAGWYGDANALHQIRWEDEWILDAWDRPVVERMDVRRSEASQLWLPLG